MNSEKNGWTRFLKRKAFYSNCAVVNEQAERIVVKAGFTTRENLKRLEREARTAAGMLCVGKDGLIGSRARSGRERIGRQR